MLAIAISKVVCNVVLISYLVRNDSTALSLFSSALNLKASSTCAIRIMMNFIPKFQNSTIVCSSDSLMQNNKQNSYVADIPNAINVSIVFTM